MRGRMETKIAGKERELMDLGARRSNPVHTSKESPQSGWKKMEWPRTELTVQRKEEGKSCEIRTDANDPLCGRASAPA